PAVFIELWVVIDQTCRQSNLFSGDKGFSGAPRTDLRVGDEPVLISEPEPLGTDSACAFCYRRVEGIPRGFCTESFTPFHDAHTCGLRIDRTLATQEADEVPILGGLDHKSGTLCGDQAGDVDVDVGTKRHEDRAYKIFLGGCAGEE